MPVPHDEERGEPQGIDVVVPTPWLGGLAVFVGAVCFVVTSVGERLVYDVRVFGPGWALPALLAGGSAWITLMFVGAQRLRIDAAGVHVRTLFRNRDVAWRDVQLLGVRAPRLPLVDRILTIVSGYRALSIPVSLHAHEAGATGMLGSVAPLAISNGVQVPTSPAVESVRAHS